MYLPILTYGKLQPVKDSWMSMNTGQSISSEIYSVSPRENLKKFTNSVECKNWVLRLVGQKDNFCKWAKTVPVGPSIAYKRSVGFHKKLVDELQSLKYMVQ